jgi:hypothetical protein
MGESIVGTLKTELVKGRVYRSRFEAEIAVVEWIGWFNHRRLHTELGDIPPVEFEALHTAALGGPPGIERGAAAASLRSPYGLAPLDGGTPAQPNTLMTTTTETR